MRAIRANRHLATAAVAGLVVLSVTSCKASAAKAVGGHAKPTGIATATASSAAGTAAGVASAVPTALPSGVASTVHGKVGAAASAAAGAVAVAKSAAGGAVGKAVGGAAELCALSDLKGAVSVPNTASQGGLVALPAGVLATVVSLVNTGRHPCELNGRAGLTPIGAGSALAAVKDTNVGSPAPGMVTIAAGGTVYVAASFSSATGCPTVQDVRLTLPGTPGVLSVPVSAGNGTHQPLTVCPGVAKISPVTPDPAKALSLLG